MKCELAEAIPAEVVSVVIRALVHHEWVIWLRLKANLDVGENCLTMLTKL